MEFSSGGAIGGARGAADSPPDSRFVMYCAPVHQVVNIIWIICKIMQTFYIGNSLLGDELAIAQQMISDLLTCFEADVLDRVPLVAEAHHIRAPNSTVIEIHSKDRAPLAAKAIFAPKLTNLGSTSPALRLRTIEDSFRFVLHKKFGALIEKSCPPLIKHSSAATGI